MNHGTILKLIHTTPAKTVKLRAGERKRIGKDLVVEKTRDGQIRLYMLI
jgi:hypothetical protein